MSYIPYNFTVLEGVAESVPQYRRITYNVLNRVLNIKTLKILT